MSLFPEEDVLTKEIETWCGFMEKLPSDEDKAVLTKLLDSCHKYSFNPFMLIIDNCQLHVYITMY